MEEEIRQLKLEIEVLKKRVHTLEQIENRRKIIRIIKIVIYIIIIMAIVFWGIKLYNQIVDYYNNVNSMISNPLQSLF